MLFLEGALQSFFLLRELSGTSRFPFAQGPNESLLFGETLVEGPLLTLEKGDLLPLRLKLRFLSREHALVRGLARNALGDLNRWRSFPSPAFKSSEPRLLSYELLIGPLVRLALDLDR